MSLLRPLRPHTEAPPPKSCRPKPLRPPPKPLPPRALRFFHRKQQQQHREQRSAAPAHASVMASKSRPGTVQIECRQSSQATHPKPSESEQCSGLFSFQNILELVFFFETFFYLYPQNDPPVKHFLSVSHHVQSPSAAHVEHSVRSSHGAAPASCEQSAPRHAPSPSASSVSQWHV